MSSSEVFSEFSARLREFIHASVRSGAASVQTFNELALSLFGLQFHHNPVYRRLCEARRIKRESILNWREVPAVPTTAFKELEPTSLGLDERTTVFLSSGTTEQQRSRHFHSAESLALYEASLLPWFERHLLSDVESLIEEQLLGALEKLPFLIFTPTAHDAPNSSLVHMFETVRRAFGARDSLFAGAIDTSGAWTLDMERALFAIRKSMCANRPLVLLGTAFNFVHLLDHFAAKNIRYRLARGSRVLETGGYKGQSREVPKTELHALITQHLGIPATHIVTEYGMSELSSQAYDRIAGNGAGEKGRTGQSEKSQDVTPPFSSAPLLPCFQFPPWARAQVISPETGREVAEGETGLIRVFDLANVRSVMAIQTEDLGVRRGDGFELIGRASQAEARGCSLMSLNASQ